MTCYKMLCRASDLDEFFVNTLATGIYIKLKSFKLGVTCTKREMCLTTVQRHHSTVILIDDRIILNLVLSLEGVDWIYLAEDKNR